MEKMVIRFFLIITFFSLQSCSNTLIGEKLENSFDINENPKLLGKTTNGSNKLGEIKKVSSRKKENEKEDEKDFGKIIKENSISNKDRFSQKPSKSIKKIIFNPQPYRIILRLSGANPSAPAETVTKALRKAGVQFEVEKIERFNEESLSKDSSFKR